MCIIVVSTSYILISIFLLGAGSDEEYLKLFSGHKSYIILLLPLLMYLLVSSLSPSQAVSGQGLNSR